MPTKGFYRLLSKWSSFSFSPSQSNTKEKQERGTSSKTEAGSETAFRVKIKQHFSDFSEFAMPALNSFIKGAQLVGFMFLRCISLILFTLYYLLNGTYFRLRKSRKPENYHWSARVFNVVAKHKYDTLVNLNSLSDFILKHSGFDHPRRVLADEVTLYEITSTDAIFVEAPPGVEVWRSRYNAFMNFGQLENAIKVIVMPIRSFYRLADEVGDPTGRLVFITNTARCGSTLLSRVFEETEDFVTLGEPTAVNYLRKFAGREDDKWVQDHTRAIIRMLCKPTHVKNFVVKITPTSTTVVPLLQKVFPNASQLFIYRDGLPVSKSMFKIWTELPMGYLNVMLSRHFHWAYIKLLNYANYYDLLDNEKEKLTLTPGYGQACFYWGNVINMYRKYRKSGLHIAAVKYEDLVGDKEFAVSRLFDYCAISRAFVKPAMRAFETDSQANSVLSMKILKKCKLPEFTPEIQNETDKICKYFDLAKLGDSCVIEGTLTRELHPCPIKT